jgi:hypothetical protein
MLDTTQREPLVGPFCPPHTGPWRAEHGVTLAPLHKALRMYRTDEADRAVACARENIPLDVAVPLAVAEVVDAAFRLRAWPDQAAPVWELARSLLVAARERVAEAGGNDNATA